MGWNQCLPLNSNQFPQQCFHNLMIDYQNKNHYHTQKCREKKTMSLFFTSLGVFVEAGEVFQHSVLEMIDHMIV